MHYQMRHLAKKLHVSAIIFMLFRDLLQQWQLTISYTAVASWRLGRDRIVVSTSRCGRDNPGSNPGHGRAVCLSVTAMPAMSFNSIIANFEIKH